MYREVEVRILGVGSWRHHPVEEASGEIIRRVSAYGAEKQHSIPLGLNVGYCVEAYKKLRNITLSSTPDLQRDLHALKT